MRDLCNFTHLVCNDISCSGESNAEGSRKALYLETRELREHAMMGPGFLLHSPKRALERRRGSQKSPHASSNYPEMHISLQEVA